MAQVAILIDGDNISASHAARIAALGQAAGRVDVHRAYADAGNGSGWNAVPGVRLIHAGSGKNAADLLLSIDAIELALTEGCDCFVLASSDRDFTHLATRLRELGRTVLGVGEGKAPASFRMSCSRFETLGPIRPTHLPAKARPAAAPGTKAIDRSICAVIRDNASSNGGIRISDLGMKLKRLHDIDKSDLPAPSLKAYLAGKSDLYELYPRDQPVCVRLTPGPLSV